MQTDLNFPLYFLMKIRQFVNLVCEAQSDFFRPTSRRFTVSKCDNRIQQGPGTAKWNE